MAEGGRRYRVLGVLGRGGFGTVFRADLLGEGSFVRPVALKVLNPAMEGVSSVAARLRDEARLLGRIRHRAVVQVDGLARLDDRWTVVMEYVHGVDLGRLIERGPVPERAALEIVGEVAGALHVVQTWPGDDGRPLGILHRDLKPANLLLTAAGEVKILDFGGARGEFVDREAKTRGMRFGSPGYVPPERLDGEERPEGDVYSLGVVLYELLAGRRLGKASIREERHGAHLADAFAHLPPVDPDTRELLVAMLAWAPEHRPAAREVERRCRALVARIEGAFLRDWAEVIVPPLLAARTLGDARSDFSSEIVTERVSAPLVPGTPAPAPARPPIAATQTFDGLELDDLPSVPPRELPAGDLVPPAVARPPAAPAGPAVALAERPPPPEPEPPPAPPAIAPRRPPPRRQPSLAVDLGVFVTVTLVAVAAVLVAFTLLCCSYGVLLTPMSMGYYGY